MSHQAMKKTQRELNRMLLKEKNPMRKGYILYDYNYMTFWRKKKTID